MPAAAREDEFGPPGAGTYYVYGQVPAVDEAEWDKLPSPQPVLCQSPDSLLLRGLGDYTYIPRAEGGILGRGKFSTVYRVHGAAKHGDSRQFALKHTPLYPHHPLIAARLLREPTLLAQLPPHPCLIGVDGFVRTEGHFYLVEECASSHVPLPKHPMPLAPSRAAYFLDQIVSVVRDGLHAGRVCHRDLKGDNVLVDVETGDILLLDLGLATHFSASEPKLTTCCGSPAFHSPEIVDALNHRPGEVTYYGPEVDIWCIALTMLALLLQTRFPLGPTHTSRHIMHDRAIDRLQELDELYPPTEPWRGMGSAAYRQLSSAERKAETAAWARVRWAMQRFLDLDARRRMAAFAQYDVGDAMRARVEAHAAEDRDREASFKTTTFLESEVKYRLPLYFDHGLSSSGGSGSGSGSGSTSPGQPIMLRNPSHEPERRILSYIKYLLRCAGILYHHVPDVHPATLQLVLPLGPAPDDPPLSRPTPAPEPARDWVSSLLGLGTKKSAVARSASVPAPKARGPTPPPSPAPRGKKAWSQAVYLRIDVERVSSASRAPSRAPSRTPSAAPSRPGSRAPSRTGSRASSATRISRKSSSSTSHSDAEAQLVPVTEGIVQNLTLNSLTLETGMTPLPFPLTDIVTPAMPAAPKLHRPQLPGSGFPPSPLGRVASPTSSSPPSPHPQARRSVSSHTHTPRVTLTLSEPRGYPLLRSALAAAVSGSRASVDEGPPLSPLTRALAIPSSGSSGAGSGAASEDDEERGRPRSKDTPPERDARSATVRPSSGSGSGTPGGTLGATPRPRRRRREASGTPAGAADGGESDSPPTSPISPPLPRGVTRLPRPHPRHERKPSGLLEAIFGKAEGPGAPRRAASVPPPRGSTPPPDALPAN